nr:tryptophan-rich sensory protein [uncultured Caproiciproducens sp.]
MDNMKNTKSIKNATQTKTVKNVKGLTSLKILNTVTFLFMVLVNVLANTLPLNNANTGQVSDSYPNLFAPAAFTFAIWGLIYFLLALFLLYQWGLFNGSNDTRKNEIVKKISRYFILSSLANAAWIFAWHSHRIPLSVLFMLILLACLAAIAGILTKEEFSLKEIILMRLPFSIYFGWVTVAALANIVVLFVSLGWSGWGGPEQFRTAIMLMLGLIIGVWIMMKNKDIAYGLTVIWAYAGILVKHLSANGFQGQYHAIVITTSICIAVLALTVLFVWAAKKTHPLKL